ncbi:MAG: NAD(P)/FAD-dependent oxidoreductase [Streptosporangiaceae bacterium]
MAGGGLAGSALAWRLAQVPGITVDLLAGRQGASDATSASGGAVRAYETLAAQRELAIASMAELLASQALRRWAGFRQAGFVYVRDDAADLPDQVGEIERALPGSATLLSAAEAFGSTADGRCWGGTDGAAVVERQAGFVSPGALRDALIADLADRPRTRVKLADLTEATVRPGGGVRWRAEDIDGEHDVLVLAAGAWTPQLLHRIGYPDPAYRTRSIQFSSYDTGSWRPAPFTDERTGLYGKPLPGGGITLGVPVREWGAAAGRAAIMPSVHVRASRLAAECFPRLRLGAVQASTSAVDCFCDPPILSLRSVPGAGSSLLTFTGGSGSSAKTVLAASQRGALEIAGW